jgi:heme/copper-type cytochrome/quinol oxidase subunit 2
VTARARASAAVVLTALVLTGCAGTDPGDEASSPAGTPTGTTAQPTDAAPRSASGLQLTVDVTGGQPSGDTGRVPVDLGEQVTLTVTSDTADEFHLHGYDLEAELVPGEPATLTFTADIAGVFEGELHEAGTVLLGLQVG